MPMLLAKSLEHLVGEKQRDALKTTVEDIELLIRQNAKRGFLALRPDRHVASVIAQLRLQGFNVELFDGYVHISWFPLVEVR